MSPNSVRAVISQMDAGGSLAAREAAAALGISVATLANWRRAGRLAPEPGRPLRYSREAVARLADAIRAGVFPRLRARANKTAVPPSPLPARSGSDPEAAFLHDAGLAGLSPDAALFPAALALLSAAGEAAAGAKPSRLAMAPAWRRRAVGECVAAWRRRAGTAFMPGVWAAARAWAGRASGEDDPLGRLYQALAAGGDKAGRGGFFTPSAMIGAALDGLGARPRNLLDPCCGTGRFLAAAARKFGLGPECLYGVEQDPLAADIARLALLLLFPAFDAPPRVWRLDALSLVPASLPGAPADGFDAVATNPPWGGRLRGAADGESRIASGETFSLFLEKSLQLLRWGGRLSFLLPESILRVRRHADVRRLLAGESRILRISRLEGRFAGVFTPVVRLEAEKRRPEREWRVEVAAPGGSFRVEQARFAANPDHAFDIDASPREEELLEKIRRAGRHSLLDNADWALGIVTGDNGRLVLEWPAGGGEPVLRGRDLFPYRIAVPSAGVRFRPETFQQCAPERLYRAPQKLLYRFVAEEPVVALDDRGRLALNSANILIPRVPGLSILAVLALLNSAPLRYYHRKRHPGRKVLRRDLEALPLPGLSRGGLAEAEALVRRLLADDAGAEAGLEKIVAMAMGLRAEEEEALAAGVSRRGKTPAAGPDKEGCTASGGYIE